MKILYVFLAWLISLHAFAFEYEVEILGTQSQFEGLGLTLRYACDGTTLGEGVIKEGKLKICGEVDNSCFVKIQPYKGEKMRLTICFILEPGVTCIDLNKNEISSSGPLNRIYQTYATQAKSEKQEYNGILSGNVSEDLLLRWIRTNPDNGLGEAALMLYSQDCTPYEWKEAYAVVSERLRKLTDFYFTNERMVKMRPTWIGNKFKDIAGKKADGSEVKLSDYVGRGQYVLLVFSASWCGGSTSQGRHYIKPVHDEYKDHPHFLVVSVALDKNIDEAIKSNEKEGFEWPHIYGKSFGTAIEEYGVNSVPYAMLIGPDGTILERDIKDVKATVEKYLTEKPLEIRETKLIAPPRLTEIH